MNERIRGLAEQAGLILTWVQYEAPTQHFVALDTELEDIQKFAELIVEETMKQVDEQVYGRGHCQWHHDEDKKWIRLHFGYGELAKLKQQVRGEMK